MSDEPNDEADSDTPVADVTRDAYDRIEALNWSRLHLLKKSPTHYKTGFGDETASFRLGTAAHMAVLEPERFKTAYEIFRGKVRRGNAWEEFETAAIRNGKAVLNVKEHAAAVAVSSAIHSHQRAQVYLNGGKPEETLKWVIAAGDLRFECKGRADYIGDAIVDLKSTADASPKAFGWSVFDYDYLGQAAWYSDGHFLATGIRKPFVFIAVEKKEPFMVGVYTVTDDQLEVGRNIYLSLLAKLDYCTKNNWWAGYTESAESELVLPRIAA